MFMLRDFIVDEDQEYEIDLSMYDLNKPQVQGLYSIPDACMQQKYVQSLESLLSGELGVWDTKPKTKMDPEERQIQEEVRKTCPY